MRRTCLLVLGIFFSVAVLADNKPLDVTITVVESPADLPAAVTKTIELPPAATDRARERSLDGLNRANEVRTLHQNLGQSIAEEAKAKGRGRGRP